MLKLIATRILLLAFAVQTFYSGGLIAHYYLNSTQYLQNCVNKAKPVLRCSGKCQLAKKMQQQPGNGNAVPERKAEYKIVLLFFRSDYAALTTDHSPTAVPATSHEQDELRRGHLRRVFQPPSAM